MPAITWRTVEIVMRGPACPQEGKIRVSPVSQEERNGIATVCINPLN